MGVLGRRAVRGVKRVRVEMGGRGEEGGKRGSGLL